MPPSLEKACNDARNHQADAGDDRHASQPLFARGRRRRGRRRRRYPFQSRKHGCRSRLAHRRPEPAGAGLIVKQHHLDAMVADARIRSRAEPNSDEPVVQAHPTAIRGFHDAWTFKTGGHLSSRICGAAGTRSGRRRRTGNSIDLRRSRRNIDDVHSRRWSGHRCASSRQLSSQAIQSRRYEEYQQ